MHRIAFATLFLHLLFHLAACFLDAELIAAFAKEKHFSIGTIFTCANNKKGMLHLVKHLMKEDLRFISVQVAVEPNDLDTTLQRVHDHFGVVLDADCPNSTTFFSQVVPEKYFFEMYHWLIISSAQLHTIRMQISKGALNINCDVHLICTQNKFSFTVYDVYNPASKHGGQLLITPLGYYNKGGLYPSGSKTNKYWKRKDLSGVTFKSAVVIPLSTNQSLEEYTTSEENRQMNSMHRFQMVTVNHCKALYNFSLEMQQTDSWGYIQANGRFDGLVSLLATRQIDFGSSPLIYKLDRMPFVDYSFGNWILRSTFIYRRPKIIARSLEIFMRPFTKNTWLAIVIFMSLVMVVLKIVFGIERRYMETIEDKIDASWSFLVLFTLGAFCQQGATCYPKLFSSRILSVFVFLFCILIYQFYSASIVSYLLMDPPRTINNLKDLLDSNLHVGIEDILIDRNYFQLTTDPIAIELFEKKVRGELNSTGFYLPEVGVSLMQKGGFAFHVETSTAYPIIEDTFTNEEICELEEVQMYQTQPMHANLVKHSPFREMMNFCNLKLLENGNMYRLRHHWDARKPTCIEETRKIEIHVGLKEFSSGLIVLSYGISFSLVFILFEFIVANYKLKYNNFFAKDAIIEYTN